MLLWLSNYKNWLSQGTSTLLDLLALPLTHATLHHVRYSKIALTLIVFVCGSEGVNYSIIVFWGRIGLSKKIHTPMAIASLSYKIQIRYINILSSYDCCNQARQLRTQLPAVLIRESLVPNRLNLCILDRKNFTAGIYFYFFI